MSASESLAELASQTADRLQDTRDHTYDELRAEVSYATGILRALAVALRPAPPVLRDVAASRSAGS